MAALCGCASVVRGTTEKVVISSNPPDATIRTSLGHSCPQSPCTIEVSRKTELTAFAEKPGYKAGQLFIGTKMGGNGAAGLAGNILLGGVIGIGVDAMSGATLDHYPNPALITLVPVDAADQSTSVNKPMPPKAPPKTGQPVG
ncbi:translation initiation factor 2 [Mesorhizobium sp. PAMC28654]|uniref:translation initiation factor 2 n=1 Tax=Mesorhizobium sp. PAMC28654 TaxID=2880934 RepID=UPI001D0B9792|nr:translation initiation factor 2 [Mesorhizobium sp. PAMC28654]UDL87653.1 translation initiation factor 2 [Mesorhizobium sp. PAMC28654]